MGDAGVDHSQMTLKGIWCEDAEWIQLAQCGVQWRTLVNMVMNIRVQ